MLICPNCHSENIDVNKFCVKCRTSLTEKDCHNCSAKVSRNAESCQNCGTFTGTVWWAIISRFLEGQTATTSTALSSRGDLTPSLATATQSPTETTEARELSSDSVTRVQVAQNATASSQLPATSHPADNTPETAIAQTASNVNISSQEENIQQTVAQMSPAVEYLDPQQRYKVLGSLTPNQTTAQVRVLDCQPLQESFLKNVIKLQQNQSGLKSLTVSQSNTLDSMVVPDLAQPYLELQSLTEQTLPEVHDAWQDDKQAVVLLEDRSELHLLTDSWKDEQVPREQILQWLNEMASLWAILEPQHCCQSLLELTNLRVDEYGDLALQQLYQDPESTHLTLQDLGKMWQTLFQQSQRTQFLSLTKLLQNLDTGEIKTHAQLLASLEECTKELQPPADSIELKNTQMMDSSDTKVNTDELAFSPEDSLEESEDHVTEGNESDDLPTVVLPKHLNRLDDAAGTHTGRQRNHNEDFFYIQTKINKQENPKSRSIEARGLYILCDGMGGHASGEVASAMAVETLKRYFEANWGEKLPDENSIREAIRLTNQAIYEVNHKDARSGSGRMGTTLVLVLIQDTKVAIAHVGDSRLYRYTRKKSLEQLTVDHEVGQREIQRGVEEAIAYSRPDAYQLTQALGPRAENFVNPDVEFLDLDEDTLLILCSDGLTDNDLLENNWQAQLVPLLGSRANLEQGVNQLIDLANQYNGHDNITVVLVRAKLRPNLDQQHWG